MKKKICFVVSSPLTANAFLLKHFDFLSKDYDLFLVANFKENLSNPFSSPFVKGVNNIVIQRDISILNDIKTICLLWKYFVGMKFDAVHTVTPKAGLLGILAGRMAGVRKRTHIFTGQVWHTRKGLIRELLIFCDRFIVMNATNILVDGESQRQFLIKNKIVNNSNAVVLGKGSISGVDTNRFIPSTTLRMEIRKKLGINSADIVFMFLGRINKDKGILDLAEAYNKLSLLHNNVRLVLVGNDEGNITSMIRERIVKADSVILFGSTDTPEILLQACDVFCLPSYREGFGTSIIEASLLEKPIICSDTYGLMETVVESVTGLRHEVGNVDSLFSKMKLLYDNKEYREALGLNGRKYVVFNFSAEIISAHWLNYYNELLKS